VGLEGLVFASQGGGAGSIQVGGIQLNDKISTDCDPTFDTDGVLYNFWELIGTGGVGFCHVTTHSIGGETHTYRDQRRLDADCAISSPCVSAWIDNDWKATTPVIGDYGDHILAQGELVRNYIDTQGRDWFNGNTLVNGTWGGTGATPWQRTSDKAGTTTTWSTIGGIARHTYDGDVSRWVCGSLTGGFLIHFVSDPSDATC
jgi:hypothetical protein